MNKFVVNRVICRKGKVTFEKKWRVCDFITKAASSKWWIIYVTLITDIYIKKHIFGPPASARRTL